MLESFKKIFAEHQEEPKTVADVRAMLRAAHGAGILDAQILSLMEGALRFSEHCAGDLMVPRTQVEVLDISEKPEEWVRKVVSLGHSRYPVVDGDIDEVRGILHAKDLLAVMSNPEIDIRTRLRPARFIPETQPLKVLLRDFRDSRNHMAFVIDEYGSVSGIITIEDVIEQIIGEIDDEFDSVSNVSDNILSVDEDHWHVKAETELAQFNEFFKTNLEDDYCETIGGIVSDRFGHVPHRGEMIEVEGFRFRVLKGDERQVRVFLLERIPETI